MPRPKALTEDEWKCLELIGKVADIFARLPVLHPADMPETVRDIHDIQNRILARPAMRAMQMKKETNT